MQMVVFRIFTGAFCNLSVRHRAGSGVRLKLRRLSRMLRSGGHRIGPAKYSGAVDYGWYKSQTGDARQPSAAEHEVACRTA
jgi:hypothetical protein